MDKEVACDLVVTGDDGQPPLARRLEPFGPAAARGSGRDVVVVGLLRDQRLGREDERSDRPGVANRAVTDLDRIDDPRLEHVDMAPAARVEPISRVSEFRYFFR